MTDTAELAEVLAFLTEHVDDIPPHRRRQALLILERAERLIPLADHQVDDLNPPETA